jgi:hypothetical protein
MLDRPIVGMAATPDGRGYWLVAADGGIFTFGDAGFYGSLGGLTPQRSRGGHGGHARRPGLLAGGRRRRRLRLRRRPVLRLHGGPVLNRPVVGMATTPDGLGYWLVASDGGHLHSAVTPPSVAPRVGTQLNQPAVGMAS